MQNLLSRTWTFSLSAAIGLCASIALAEEPKIVIHEEISWRAMGNSGMEMAVLTGDPRTAAPYSFMVKMPQGTRIPPHSHPDVWRHSTIISGTLLWAFGDTFDEAAMVALTPGSFWTEPSGANHYGWARDGDVLAVGTAMGPSGMMPAKSN
ncbi:cupin domain-containing protein [Algirhabdus cladophorae]|uniref:cupin domain-containing protein n=1 Tax=Algirhabdus cladophorae TaxID=3377108 RepID=UPI003B8467A7